MGLLKFKGFFIVMLCSIAAIGMAYFFLYRPKTAEIEKLKKELKKEYEKVYEAEKKITAVPNPEKRMKEIRTRLKRLEEKITKREETPRIIRELSTRIADYNLQLISIAPKEADEKEELPQGVDKVYIELQIKAQYKDFGKFIATFRELSPIFTIEKMHLEKKEGEKGNSIYIFLTLSRYVFG